MRLVLHAFNESSSVGKRRKHVASAVGPLAFLWIVIFACVDARAVMGDEASPLSGGVDYESTVRPLLQTHCFGCHGEGEVKGDLRLDTLSTDLKRDRRAAESWHDVRERVQLGEMPPPNEGTLPSEQRKQLVRWISSQLEKGNQNDSEGHVVLRRLNRVEYQNTMCDLLGIETDYAANLPPEGLSPEGFKNNGSTLQVSELQLEYYLAAARMGLSKAIVTRNKPETYEHSFDKSIEDKGRGSQLLDHDEQFVARLMEYPNDGEVIVRVTAKAKLAKDRGFPQLRVAIGYRADVHAPRKHFPSIDLSNEEEFATFEFRGRIEDFPLPSKTQSKFPGLLIWVDNAYAQGREKSRKKPKKKKAGNQAQESEMELAYPTIEVQRVEFVGPEFKTWPPSHHTSILFPSSQLETDESTYATKVLQRFLGRAFRRPVMQADWRPYLGFYAQLRESGQSVEASMRETLASVLISPSFLYLWEPVSDQPRALTDWELASRLSYFLWSTMPDATLMQLAGEGRLHDDDVLREQVDRMIADPRSRQFVENFAGQWLDIDSVDRVAVNPEFYPDFQNELKVSMRGETLAFFEELLRENLSALNMLDSSFLMLNEPLAKHYGIPGPRGSEFKRIALDRGDPRGGILTQASILLGNSTGEDSHPVKRAVWIRDRLLGDPPADPPPDVPELDATDPKFASLSVREQLRAHRNTSACNDCHRGIDPWGIALEHFGADGLWRDDIKRKKVRGRGFTKLEIETNTTLPDGFDIHGAQDLKSYLVNHRAEQFSRALTRRLLSYALGRSVGVSDESTVETLNQIFAQQDHRLQPLIRAIVTNDVFRNK